MDQRSTSSDVDGVGRADGDAPRPTLKPLDEYSAVNRTPLQRSMSIVAGVIAAMVLGCPLGMFIGIVYRNQVHGPGSAILWDQLAVGVIAWIVLSVIFGTIFVMKSRAK